LPSDEITVLVAQMSAYRSDEQQAAVMAAQEAPMGNRNVAGYPPGRTVASADPDPSRPRQGNLIVAEVHS
jgi:hypothetical protein